MTTPTAGEAPQGSMRVILTDAIRYWEPRRFVYNLVLGLVVAGWFGATWPHFRAALAPGPLSKFFVLAVLANICYCAAYLVDVPVQYSTLQPIWRGRRWLLWVVGALFASVLASYWLLDEIYPVFGP